MRVSGVGPAPGDTAWGLSDDNEETSDNEGGERILSDSILVFKYILKHYKHIKSSLLTPVHLINSLQI